MDISDKGGGFGSMPGDLVDDLITFFNVNPPLPRTQDFLVQLAKTEHAAANATKVAYNVEVAYKCVFIKLDLLTAQDPGKPQPVRDSAVNNIIGTLSSLQGLWV